MSLHAAELCTLLVDEVYGGLSSRVFGVLLRLGRLTLPSLLVAVRLPSRQLKNGLAVLIQQHLVRHYTSPEDDHTFYEADWQSAYSLVRSGKVIRLAENLFGETAGTATLNLLLQGHATIGDLTEAYSTLLHRTRAPTAIDTLPEHSRNDDGMGSVGVNGGSIINKASNSATTLARLHATISKLLDIGFVRQLREEHFRGPTDNYNEAERLIKWSGNGVEGTGNKAKVELRSKVRRQLMKWQDGYDVEEGLDEKKNGLKRLLQEDDSTTSSKRVKLDLAKPNGQNGHLTEDEEVPEEPVRLNGKLVVRVAHDKCGVYFRNQELVELAKRKVGKTTSLVFEALLHRIGQRLNRCRDVFAGPNEEEPDPSTSPTVTTIELFSILPKEVDLRSDIANVDAIRLNTKQVDRPRTESRRRRLDHDQAVAVGQASSDEDDKDLDPKDIDEHGNIPGVVQDMNESHLAQDYREGSTTNGQTTVDRTVSRQQWHNMQLLKQHLLILAEDSYHFVRLISSKGIDEWAVDFQALVTILSQRELEIVATERFGPVALRLIRILQEKGKLDEKQISNFALVKQKEIRMTLAAMHEAGFLELQEIPRDNSRAASRTIFLWHFDAERCRQLVLEDIYKTMARLLQRAASERRELRVLLTKADRSDVKGNEEIYLSEPERRELQKWRDKEEKLLVQVGRLDRLVGVFRDY